MATSPQQTEPSAPAAAAAPLKDLADRIVDSYRSDDCPAHGDTMQLPSRAKAIEIIELLRRLLFPGFFEPTTNPSTTVRKHVEQLVPMVHDRLREQISKALCYQQRSAAAKDRPDAEQAAYQITTKCLEQIPHLRSLLSGDIQAAYDGDPAATSRQEAIFCYPGLDAIFIHRVAHELYTLNVPLLPRIMSEYAHNETGIDIHPGAQIGTSFFIDHGTGVVIGETTVIGDHVQIYQGVTLGALAPKDAKVWRGRKRHPTLEDEVVIYPNATILGGDTVIGKGCVINGSVFLTHSVAPGHTVRISHPEPQLRARRQRV